MATITRTMVHAFWQILEAYPPKDGEYVVCFQTDDGDYGWPDVWEFTARNGWEPVYKTDITQYPTHWCNLPMPKE